MTPTQNKAPSKFKQSLHILRGSTSFIRGLNQLRIMFWEVWRFDLSRPGVRTGFQTRPTYENPAESMWYSPGETSTLTEMIVFSSQWVKSSSALSRENFEAVFIDLGMGAGKPSMIALESRAYLWAFGLELNPELTSLANENFQKRKASRGGRAQGLTGDVASLKSIEMLDEQIRATLPRGTEYLPVFFNKNSFGRETLKASLECLDKKFPEYIYLYQNPVHRDLLTNMFIHRLVLDGGLRKNKDWLLAARSSQI